MPLLSFQCFHCNCGGTPVHTSLCLVAFPAIPFKVVGVVRVGMLLALPVMAAAAEANCNTDIQQLQPRQHLLQRGREAEPAVHEATVGIHLLQHST